MSRFGWNLLSNFSASAWVAAAQLACIPVYIHLLGIEAFGLIGFYATLVAVLQVLDLGLSPTMNREMARLSASHADAGKIRDFSRTLEVVYWTLGVVLGVLILLVSHLIAVRWINTRAVSSSEAQSAVMIMGALVALQWPLSFYQSGLFGLQRQVRANVVRVLATTISNGGAVLALLFLSSSVEVFFAWQMFTMALQVTVMRAVFWRSLPVSNRRTLFDGRLLGEVMSFARGMTGIAFFGAILAQMDKIVVSKQMPLEMFGYYALASTVAGALLLFVNPLFIAIFPRLSSLVASDDQSAVREVYHSSTQMLACLVIPAALVLALFPGDVLLAWTGSEVSAENSAGILRLLVIGTAINGMMHLPYALQLAHGWTDLGLKITVTKVFILLPLLIISVSEFGVIGAAASWAALNISYLAVGLPLTHRRLLKGDARIWILRDVVMPGVAAALVVAVARLAWTNMVSDPGPIRSVVMLVSIGVLACVAAISAAPMVRRHVLTAGRRLLAQRI